MNYEHLLFDLDGTLTKSAPGIINSVRYALRRYGIEEADDEKLSRFIGPPLVDSFRDFYGFDERKAREAMGVYREYFGEKGLFENAVYDGIPEALGALKAGGKTLYVATSKPEIYMRRILEHFDLARFFAFAGGSDIEETRSQKWQVIDFVIAENNLSAAAERGEVLMIGDRKHDIDGAKKNGIDSMGVLWGYGSREELSEHGATHIVERPSDLLRLLR